MIGLHAVIDTNEQQPFNYIKICTASIRMLSVRQLEK